MNVYQGCRRQTCIGGNLNSYFSLLARLWYRHRLPFLATSRRYRGNIAATSRQHHGNIMATRGDIRQHAATRGDTWRYAAILASQIKCELEKKKKRYICGYVRITRPIQGLVGLPKTFIFASNDQCFFTLIHPQVRFVLLFLILSSLPFRLQIFKINISVLPFPVNQDIIFCFPGSRRVC